MTTPIATQVPVRGAKQPPIYPLIVGNNGGFMQIRSSSAQGSCGVHSYPCKHPGVDVNGPRGTIVRAPESGTIVAIADGSSAPFSGYGPWLVIIHGDQSGKFHLLAHLDPASSSMGPMGARVIAGDPIGRVSAANHTHWEMRRRVYPIKGESNQTNNSDPIAWLQGSSLAGMLIVGLALAGLYWVWKE